MYVGCQLLKGGVVTYSRRRAVMVGTGYNYNMFKSRPTACD